MEIHSNRITGGVINVQSIIGKEAQGILKQDSRIAVLASIDNDGMPHLNIVSSLQAFSDTQLTVNLTCDKIKNNILNAGPTRLFWFYRLIWAGFGVLCIIHIMKIMKQITALIFLI